MRFGCLQASHVTVHRRIARRFLIKTETQVQLGFVIGALAASNVIDPKKWSRWRRVSEVLLVFV